jgi:peptidoglycan/LPS O-acetylase OafA/YrhL
LFLFRWLRWTNIILFIAVGALIGLVASMFVMESYTIDYFLQRITERTLCMVAGGLSALVFRFILLGRDGEVHRVPLRGET